MKLPILLSQFLYQTKKLDLPGIGSFTLDPSAVIPETSDRGQQTTASGISFKNANIPLADDALIEFIKQHTGKMKSLASADLDFYLTTGKQLLNIGKPFYLEGIGTLVKNKEGKLDFVQGDYMSVKLDDPDNRRKTNTFEEPPREYEPKSNSGRQAILLIALILGLVAIGWGGYHLYKRNNFVEPGNEPQATVIQDTTPARTDSAPTNPTVAQTVPPQKDTLSVKPVNSLALPATPPAVQETADGIPYKFVILETDKKGRALRRYNQLIGFQLNIKMDQKDSSYFKLYFPITAAPRDTTHIKDSLADVYAAQVTIER